MAENLAGSYQADDDSPDASIRMRFICRLPASFAAQMMNTYAVLALMPVCATKLARFHGLAAFL